MNLIITQYIRQKECKNCSKEDIEVITDSLGKDIYTILKGNSLPPHTRLIKSYATSKHGARRIVFLIDMVSKDAFLVFYRKKDDPIGKNISIKNKFFKKRLHEYLLFMREDIEKGYYLSIKIKHP
jgi:hypothetical protein